MVAPLLIETTELVEQENSDAQDLLVRRRLLILTGIGGWAASTTHARVDIPAAAVRISPVELMTTTIIYCGGDFEDYSLVFLR